MATLPTQYATVAQLQQRYDARMVGDLSSDDGSGTTNSATLNAVLSDATAEINAAILLGSRYTATDINNLINSGDTLLPRLCCDLAMFDLQLRRGVGQPSERYKASVEIIKQIKEGKAVLNLADSQSAGLPSLVTLTSTQAQNAEPMTSCPFLGGPSDTRTIDDPGSFGSGSYPATADYGGGA